MASIFDTFKSILGINSKSSSSNKNSNIQPTPSRAGATSTFGSGDNKTTVTYDKNGNATYTKVGTQSSPSGSGSSGGARGENLLDYNTDFSNLLNNQLSGYSSAVGAANNNARAIDLTGIINSYNANLQSTIDTLTKSLNNSINAVNTKADQSRNDLLTSLKRFQEANAENMRAQQEDYNNARASLEDETFMKQRNSAANAAARGLGGSGLQQLAQLQNRIAAGKDVSNLAIKNQKAQDSLRKALANAQEDYDTNIKNINENTLQSILNLQDQNAQAINAARTANTNKINELQYNERVRQEQARAQAASANAAYNNAKSAALQSYNQGVATLKGIQNNFENELSKTVYDYLNTKKKTDVSKLSNKQKNELNSKLSDLYRTYNQRVNGDLQDYANVAATYGLDSSYTDTAVKNLKTIFDKYKI